MEIKILVGIIFIAIVVALILWVLLWVSKHGDSGGKIWDWTSPAKRAGNRGEEAASDIIESVLSDGDRHIRNVEIFYDGEKAECDNIIVNNYGIYIIEVKTIEGRLIGKEDDYKWVQDNTDQWGIRHFDEIKNPVRQVKRQIHFLANKLKDNGIRVWVEGYVIFMYGNAPYSDEMFLESVEDINAVIHGNTKKQLVNYEVDRVVKILSR